MINVFYRRFNHIDSNYWPSSFTVQLMSWPQLICLYTWFDMKFMFILCRIHNMKLSKFKLVCMLSFVLYITSSSLVPFFHFTVNAVGRNSFFDHHAMTHSLCLPVAILATWTYQSLNWNDYSLTIALNQLKVYSWKWCQICI